MAVVKSWSGDGLTGFPITLTSVNLASTKGTNDNEFNALLGSGVVVRAGTGSQAARLSYEKATNTPAAVEWNGLNLSAGAIRIKYTAPTGGALAATHNFIRSRNAGALNFAIGVTSATVGTASVRIADAANSALGGTGSAVVLDGSEYRIELKWAHQTTTTGRIELKVFNWGTDTQVGSTVTLTNVNIGTLTTRLLLGLEGNTPEAGTFSMAAFAVADTEAYIGAPVDAVTPSAPVVTGSASPTSPAPGQTVTLTGTATPAASGGGSITSSGWTAQNTAAQAYTLGGSGNTRTFTAPYRTQSEAAVFRFSATSSNGLTTTTDVTVTTSKHRRWALKPDGSLGYVISGGSTVTPPADPILAVSVVNKDGASDVNWTLDSKGHTVDLKFDKTPEPWTITKSGTATGTWTAGRLTNGTIYTVVVTPIVDGTTRPDLAKTVTLAPQADAVSTTRRAFGMYSGDLNEASMMSTFGTKTINGVVTTKDNEVTSQYIQFWGQGKGKDAQGNWVRDFETPTFPNFNLGSTTNKGKGTEYYLAEHNVWRCLTFAAHSCSVVPWIAAGRAANPTGYDWAVDVVDRWLAKCNSVYQLDTDRPFWVFMNSEPDVGSNTSVGSYVPEATKHADFYSFWWARARQNYPGMKVGLWLGGSRTDWILDLLTNLTVAPDIFTLDSYSNSTNNVSVLSVFNSDTAKFRTGGAWFTQAERLRKLARTGLAANVNNPPIPIGMTEYGVSKYAIKPGPDGRTGTADDIQELRHTDQEMADFIKGNSTWAGAGVRQALVDANVLFSIYFNTDHGPNGFHKMDDGNHPLAVAAFRDELFKAQPAG